MNKDLLIIYKNCVVMNLGRLKKMYVFASTTMTEEEVRDLIKQHPDFTRDIIEEVVGIFIDFNAETQILAVSYDPWVVRFFQNPTDEVQKYILNYAKENKNSSLIHMINNPNKEIMRELMIPHARHDSHNRDAAWAYIDGEIYIANTHPSCFSKYREEKESDAFKVTHRKYVKEYVDKNETNIPVACGALVYEGVYDYTDEKKCIYIDPVTVFNITIEEVVQKLKERFPDYTIYNDDEFEIDVDNNKIKYMRLAKLKKWRKRYEKID
jgi:hypothetical protein